MHGAKELNIDAVLISVMPQAPLIDAEHTTHTIFWQ
jgi:hypothetical protein